MYLASLSILAPFVREFVDAVILLSRFPNFNQDRAVGGDGDFKGVGESAQVFLLPEIANGL